VVGIAQRRRVKMADMPGKTMARRDRPLGKTRDGCAKMRHDE
jgi:hypothetical protein